jgi:hypothetical protein
MDVGLDEKAVLRQLAERIGDGLSKLRRSGGWTTSKEFAIANYINPSQYGRNERGDTTLSLKVVMRHVIAHGIGARLFILFISGAQPETSKNEIVLQRDNDLSLDTELLAITKAIGTVLASVRVQLGYPDVASFLKVTALHNDTYRRMEAGGYNMPLRSLAKALVDLGISVDRFITLLAAEISTPGR